MIRLYRITISQFVYGYLPAHKRMPLRLTFLRRILRPFVILMSEWITWRDRANTKARVTGETLSLQWYLNSLFDPVAQAIYIQSAGLSGVNAGYTSSQAAYYIAAGHTASQPTRFVAIGYPGQDTIFGNFSFAVFIPVALAGQANAISNIVRSYKLAGKSFTIITF